MADETNPVLVDTSASAQAVASARGGAGSEDGGEVSPIRLSQGQAQPEAVEPAQVTTGEPLSEEEIARIVARLPPLPVEPGDESDFRLPEDLLPPPRPG